MGMLDDFRKKPDHVKQNMAFGTALGVTLMIGLVWVSTLPARLGDDVQLSAVKEEIVEQKADAPKKERASFGEMFGNIQAQFGAVVEGVSKLKDLGGSTEDTSSEAETAEEAPNEVTEPEPESVEVVGTTSARKKQVILIGTSTKESEPSTTSIR